jgi:CRP-like cAMP-binding protein
METIDELLSHHAFFRGLKPEFLALIAGCAQNVHFDRGAYLAREGDAADRFFAIRAGTVGIETHIPSQRPMTLQTIGAGEILGWSWLFPPYVWQFDARARDAVRATAFDGACLRSKCDADPALGYELMKRLAQQVSARLEAARRQLLDMYGPDVAR